MLIGISLLYHPTNEAYTRIVEWSATQDVGEYKDLPDKDPSVFIYRHHYNISRSLLTNFRTFSIFLRRTEIFYEQQTDKHLLFNFSLYSTFANIKITSQLFSP